MAYKPVYSHEKLRQEVLNDPEARAIYEATKLQIDLAMKLKKARMKRNMTQDDVAEIMHTKKPAISRIEAVNDDVKNFPSLLTLAKYASAIGYELNVKLAPIKMAKKAKTHTIRGVRSANSLPFIDKCSSNARVMFKKKPKASTRDDRKK